MKDIVKKSLINILKKLDYPEIPVEIQKPKNDIEADFATNIAFKLSKQLDKNPYEIASNLKNNIEDDLFSSIEVAKPGFINLKINPDIIIKHLKKIIDEKHNYGKNDCGKKKKVLVEFVSANPTGPLTVGHGRGAIIGDIISNIYSWNGFNVEREYYYNNAGRQMRKLGESVYSRYLDLNNIKNEFPEDGYKGDYIKNIALKIKKKYSNRYVEKNDLDVFIKESEKEIFSNINNTLEKIGIKFDTFFNENTLYENKKIYKTIEDLDEVGLIYKKDNATWFKGTKVGRNVDRVLIKSTGEPTYRLPDIAYHITKYERNYDLCIDVFGADHMDAYPDVLEAVNQLGFDKNKIKVLIHQFISILKDGKPIKMSTRAANFITLDELTKEVGSDVLRYFFIMRHMNSHLNFDLKLAKEKSEENPVFYIQYANARISNILKKAIDINIDKKINLSNLKADDELKIINKLIDFEDLVKKLIDTNEPQMLANYLHELSSLFHKYYAHNRVIQENLELTKSRLVLISAIQIVIQNGLKILGISQPEKM